MRIVIDINDNLIARWGSLFVHPVGYDAANVRLYVPGFEYASGQEGQQAFQVSIMQQIPPQPLRQNPQMQQHPLYPASELPQDYPPPQVPGGYQPPATPPQSFIPPAKPQFPPENNKVSSQQPTPSNVPPLSIVAPDKENKDPESTNKKESVDEPKVEHPPDDKPETET